MSAKHQKITITIPKAYTPAEREAISLEVMDAIRYRTQEKNVDKNGKAFPKYSKEYVNSLNFKIAGKSKGDVNLTLSGDMLTAMKLLDQGRGKIIIGYEKDSEENAKADGNIRGTYGKTKGDRSKARDFLGISKEELAKIFQKYPLDDREASKERASNVLDTAAEAGELADAGIETDNSDG